MNVQVFNGVAPDFKPLATFDFHCPKCGGQYRMPADYLVQRVADKVEEYYRERCEQLQAENLRLMEIIQLGNMTQMIKTLAKENKL